MSLITSNVDSLEEFEENYENGELQNSFIPGNQSQSKPVSFIDYKSLVLWRNPLLTVRYFFKEICLHIRAMSLRISNHSRMAQFAISVLIILAYFNSVVGHKIPIFGWILKKSLWSVYWFFLGLLSSIGLGTGIHTFALYLGPHIASVTLAANECGYLNFIEDSYPNYLECPKVPDPRWATTIWNIMCKVRLESFMWGLGTATGELPPYFMGRAARMSGRDDREDVLLEFEQLERKKEEDPGSLTYLDMMKLAVRDAVQRAGFWGILACASVPNPLFDLAGLTCGNFLIPFWTFFGATLIGKAVVKTTVQQMLVILVFNETLVPSVVEILSRIPLIGHSLQTILPRYIAKQKEKFHKNRRGETSEKSLISKAYNIFVMFTFFYFFVSVINSLAQAHYKRLAKRSS